MFSFETLRSETRQAGRAEPKPKGFQNTTAPKLQKITLLQSAECALIFQRGSWEWGKGNLQRRFELKSWSAHKYEDRHLCISINDKVYHWSTRGVSTQISGCYYTRYVSPPSCAPPAKALCFLCNVIRINKICHESTTKCDVNRHQNLQDTSKLARWRLVDFRDACELARFRWKVYVIKPWAPRSSPWLQMGRGNEPNRSSGRSNDARQGEKSRIVSVGVMSRAAPPRFDTRHLCCIFQTTYPPHVRE